MSKIEGILVENSYTDFCMKRIKFYSNDISLKTSDEILDRIKELMKMANTVEFATYNHGQVKDFYCHLDYMIKFHYTKFQNIKL